MKPFGELIEYACPGFKMSLQNTGDNIALWIEEVAEKFDFSLHDDVLAIVHDNAANIVKALKILEEKHGVASLRCAGHTTQLIVNHALKEPRINKALGAARSLVTYFHSSEVATLKLKLKQEQMGTPQHKLSQDVPIRWNSSFYMIKRLLEQRWPVPATLSDPEVTKAGKHYLDMRADQWSILGGTYMKALEPFEQATVFLSGEGICHAAAEIASRWKVETTYDEDGKNVCIFAAALDPRFRKLKFLSTDDILKVKIKLQTLALDARRVRVREEPDSPVAS
ncbi:hypothetical protein KUCAC02_003934 [Chaenocephalus aceratus]|uniref:Uncharacterized protein n=1 Tax=Chaenocephalus aceratus TaxID=36190 RepID=A0ACB9WX14_CHAAC|nr:hypothetical protein KUCAC02_003934 [Chaenocephalus aceratus]